MIVGRTKSRLWLFGSMVVVCGFPLLLLYAIASNVIEAMHVSDQAARQRVTTSAVVAWIERHRARKTTRLDTASLYLTSASDSLARAEVQDRATKLVAQSNGQLAEVQLVTTPEQEANGTVAIQLTLSIDNAGLLNLLYAVESGLPILDVTSLITQQAHDRSDDNGSINSSLHVEMTVQGHWRKVSG